MIVLVLHLLQTLLDYLHNVCIFAALVSERFLVIIELGLQNLHLLLCHSQFWLVLLFLCLTSLLHRGIRFILCEALYLLQLVTDFLQLIILLLYLSLKILDLAFDGDARAAAGLRLLEDLFVFLLKYSSILLRFIQIRLTCLEGLFGYV